MTQLREVKVWGGPSTDGTVRIYCGSLHVGYAIPLRGSDDEFYTFDNFFPLLIHIPSKKDKVLEDIIIAVELSFKELLKKIAK